MPFKGPQPRRGRCFGLQRNKDPVRCGAGVPGHRQEQLTQTLFSRTIDTCFRRNASPRSAAKVRRRVRGAGLSHSLRPSLEPWPAPPDRFQGLRCCQEEEVRRNKSPRWLQQFWPMQTRPRTRWGRLGVSALQLQPHRPPPLLLRLLLPTSLKKKLPTNNQLQLLLRYPQGKGYK